MTNKLDLLIKNGRILDGTGNPAFEADIGVIGGEIAAENGKILGATSGKVLRRG